MNIKKHILRGIIIAVSIIAILLIIVLILGRDEQPPYDNDLRVAYKHIPDKENAIFYFMRASEHMKMPEEEKDQFELIDTKFHDKDWDSSSFAALMEANAFALKSYEKGLQCTRSQVPEMKSVERISDFHLPSLKLLKLARLASMRSALYFKSGKDKEAFDEALNIVKFGALIEASNCDFFVFLIGSAIKAYGLRRIRSFLPHTSLDSSSLVSYYIQPLEKYYSNERGWANTYRIEYMDMEKIIDQVKDSDLHFPKNILRNYSYQPNRTKRMYAEALRIMIKNTTKHYSEIERIEFPFVTSNMLYILVPNSIGRTLFNIAMPNVERAQERRYGKDFSITATQLLIALKCYKIKNNKLPQSLQELVPEYFKQVPLDPFDGKEMKYSASKAILYSVGTSLKDAGGADDSSLWDSKKALVQRYEQPTLRIE